MLNITLTVEQLWQSVPGGSATYIRELTTALAARGDVTLTGVRARQKGEAGTASTAGPEGKGLPASMEIADSRLPRPLLYQGWSHLRWPRLPGSPPDVIHATTWAIPRRSAPLVVTVHDVAFRRTPQHFTPRGVAFFERALAITRREADVVVVPSNASRDDAIAEEIDPDRIWVIPHGVTRLPTSEDDVARFRAQHTLTRPYVFWCGAIEPRKNLTGLLRAFGQVVHDADLDLVLAGPDGWGNAADDVRRLYEALPSGRVRVLGNLPWSDLHVAYAGARAFCFPSLWEGFGMPVLEAQTHGVPVVTSMATSMAEVCGAGAVLVDPHDDASIAAGILTAVGPKHDRLSVAALANAANYTWEQSAAQHVAAYRAAITKH